MPKSHEKTQRGNPHQLTIKQHCFPRKSINRFTNKDGLVHVHLIEYGRTVFLKPDDNNFCALRTWDQRAEAGFMREIEDKYQDLADKIVTGKIVRRLSLEENNVINDMYILWHCRWHWNKNPIEDQKIKGALDVSRKLPKEDQERLEKEGIGVIRPDLTISGRSLAGVKIQQNIIDERESMSGNSWAILNSRGTEFIVPDNASDRCMVPVSPNICLVSGKGYQFVNESKVATMNDLAKSASERYYFARRL